MSAARFLDTLPDLEALRRRCQSLAVLDAVLCPEWEFRYFSFNSAWAPGEMLSSMRNGEGDDWLIWFGPPGAIVKGFVLGCPMAEGCPRPGVVDAVPEAFRAFLDEPAFSIDKTTFCLWRPRGDGWSIGPIDPPPVEDPDGSALLLPFLDGDPETYRLWGEEYFGSRLNPKAIEQVYRHHPLSEFLVRSLNPQVDLDALREEVAQIGYPV